MFLVLGLKFIPTPYFTNYDIGDTCKRLLILMKLQIYFSGENTKKELTKKELKIYVISAWTPLYWMVSPVMIYWGSGFMNDMKSIFVKKKRQRTAIYFLSRDAKWHSFKNKMNSSW